MRRLLTLLLLALPLVAPAAELSQRTASKLSAAMDDPGRPAADRARDGNRKPLATLEFFGLTDEMTVLELVPGGGWYTRLLAPTLAERGKLYVSIGTGNIEENLLGEPGFEAVEVLPFDAIDGREGRRMNMKPFSFGVDDVDLVLTFRNLHNFTAAGRAEMNRATWAALKPGGL